MSQPFVGQIQAFGFNFAPSGWQQCNGQLLAISQYQALFALIGTTYGGNGTTTFGLPDLRGRASLSQGQGPSTSNYVIGQAGGAETVTLLSTQMPSHNHLIGVNHVNATATDPTNQLPGIVNSGGRSGATVYPGYNPVPQTGTLAPTAMSVTGGNQPHPNLQPYLTVNFCIAINGIFPSRN